MDSTVSAMANTNAHLTSSEVSCEKNVQNTEVLAIQKPLYRDMVTSLEEGFEDPEEIVRTVTEELYPDAIEKIDDHHEGLGYNPNPEIKISLEEYESWSQPW
ncbi:hypothetical protein SESBI_14313 [Sesbania bispinosa]|nr:hypothetical protein SESBI_14313 [Sesbania bispinosa]